MEIRNNVKIYDFPTKYNNKRLGLLFTAFNTVIMLLMCQKSSNDGFLKLKKCVLISSKRRKSS